MVETINQWENKTLSEILTVRHGKSQHEVLVEYGKYPILATGGQIGWTNKPLYTKPSVLIGRKGTINKPQYIDKSFWTIDTLFYTEINEGYIPKFIYYLFKSIDWLSLNEASGVPSLSSKNIERLEVKVPNKSIQKKIATVLSDMDELIESLEKVIDKKKKIKQGSMQQLLTGKKRLRGFNGKWENTSFEKAFTLIPSEALSKSTKTYYERGRYPIVDQGNRIISGYTNNSEAVYENNKGGVIVFGDHTRSLKFIDFDFVSGGDGVRILKSSGSSKTIFLYYKLLNKKVVNTGYNRHFSQLKEMCFNLPMYEEQQAIASILSDMDSEIELLEEKLEKYEQVKEGMMQQLLTGRIRLI